MENFNLNPQIIIFGLWVIACKGFALWKSARNDQPRWFVALLVINTVGILEIIYLIFFQSKDRYWEKIVSLLKKSSPVHLQLK